MSVVAVVSPGGSPGATTTALALCLCWPGQVLLAECDPDGGDMAAGYFGGHVGADRGLVRLALHSGEGIDRGAAEVVKQAVALDEPGRRPVLLGPRDPFQAQALTPADWERIAGLLAGMPGDVIADVGQVRAAGWPFPVLDAADLIVMVMRPSLRQILRAGPRLTAIRDALGEHIGLGLVVVGDGPYSAAAVRGFLGGDFAVVLVLPDDRRAAGRLSDGLAYRRDIRMSGLMRAARSAARTLHDEATRQRPAHGSTGALAGGRP